MKIVEILSGRAQNGAAVHCRLLVRELSRRGHEMTLLCRPGAWIAGQIDTEASVVETDLSRWPPAEISRIARLLDKQGADVLHTHMSRAHFFGVLLRWKTGVPCVATAHSRWIQPHWRFNDRVIAVSEVTGRFHRRFNLVPARSIEVIHNFVDSRFFAEPPPEARRAERAALGLEPETPLLGVLGEILPHKGIIELIRALPEVLAASPDCRLLVAGSGPVAHRERLKSEAARLKVLSSIVWAGHREDVAGLLHALDIVVLPSLDENLPLSVLEAMAAGRPVVATAVGGVPECVRAGETGFLVPPRDPGALARALVALLANPQLRRRFGEAGRERARGDFSPALQVPRIEAALSLAAGGRTAKPTG